MRILNPENPTLINVLVNLKNGVSPIYQNWK